jgi:hypothetical protein
MVWKNYIIIKKLHFLQRQMQKILIVILIFMKEING